MELLKRELIRLRDKGALGSRNLSGKSFELVKEPDLVVDRIICVYRCRRSVHFC